MSTKLNFIKSEQRRLKWKQVEFRDNFMYMRWKQRIYRDAFEMPRLRLRR